MVVLSASLLSKNGKVMVARQFMEISRIRLEGLLAAFPKLLSSESRQHTFIDTESVRYVYQPIENYFLLLITNKTSNIVEDLHTMRLMAKLVPDICSHLTEASIKEKQFDLIFAFDELISAGGYSENMTSVQQIRTNMEMESHEEKLHLMIQKTKQENAIADMKRQQQRIKEEQREKQRMERQLSGNQLLSPFQRSGNSSISSFMSSSSGFGSNSNQPTSPVGSGPSYSAPSSTSTTTTTAPTIGSGMKLGGSKKGNSFIDAMKAEDNLKDIPPVAAMSGVEVNAPNVEHIVPVEPVNITMDEKINVTLNRDGAIDALEVKGNLYVSGNDPESAMCRLRLIPSRTNAVAFQTHPKVDKKLFESESILGLKDGTKPFPPTRVAVLRWGIKTLDESFLPLNITCWPEEESAGKISVSLEYSMDRDMTLENVNILIPLGCVDMPQITQIDGAYQHNPAANSLIWHLDTVSSSNNAGSLEFIIRGSDLDAFYPISVSFTSRSTYCELSVENVLKISDGSPVKYGFEKCLATDLYVVE